LVGNGGNGINTEKKNGISIEEMQCLASWTTYLNHQNNATHTLAR
jgi:hypothetical protein